MEVGREVAGQRAVPAAYEDGCHRRHVRIEPGFDAAFDGPRVGLGGGRVLLRREEQGHVHRYAGVDRLLDRLEAGRRAGDLDEEVGPAGQGVEPRGIGRGRGRIVGQERRDLERDEPVDAVGPVEGRPEQVGRPTQVVQRQVEEDLLRLCAARGKSPNLLVVVR